MSVSQVLWDLSDGVSGQPDRDEDGLALGPAAVLSAMMELARAPGTFGSLPSFLRHLAARGTVTQEALLGMLGRTNEPAAELWPDDAEDVWPRALALDGARNGKIDGLTQPAPSGGFNFPSTGFDAIHTYRLHVPVGGMLIVRLDIVGSGRAADRTDLDLELLDFRADRLADSRGEMASETVGHLVESGWYIVRVRDGGSGNRADYRLQASIETLD
jgi:hypothetical protein